MIDRAYTNFIQNAYCDCRKPVSTILVMGKGVCYCMFEDICNPQHDNVKSIGQNKYSRLSGRRNCGSYII